jgi:hypothetical protein
LVMVFVMRGIGDLRLRLDADRGKRQGDSNRNARMV